MIIIFNYLEEKRSFEQKLKQNIKDFQVKAENFDTVDKIMQENFQRLEETKNRDLERLIEMRNETNKKIKSWSNELPIVGESISMKDPNNYRNVNINQQLNLISNSKREILETLENWEFDIELHIIKIKETINSLENKIQLHNLLEEDYTLFNSLILERIEYLKELESKWMKDFNGYQDSKRLFSTM